MFSRIKTLGCWSVILIFNHQVSQVSLNVHTYNIFAGNRANDTQLVGEKICAFLTLGKDRTITQKKNTFICNYKKKEVEFKEDSSNIQLEFSKNKNSVKSIFPYEIMQVDLTK